MSILYTGWSNTSGMDRSDTPRLVYPSNQGTTCTPHEFLLPLAVTIVCAQSGVDCLFISIHPKGSHRPLFTKSMSFEELEALSDLPTSSLPSKSDQLPPWSLTLLGETDIAEYTVIPNLPVYIVCSSDPSPGAYSFPDFSSALFGRLLLSPPPASASLLHVSRVYCTTPIRRGILYSRYLREYSPLPSLQYSMQSSVYDTFHWAYDNILTHLHYYEGEDPEAETVMEEYSRLADAYHEETLKVHTGESVGGLERAAQGVVSAAFQKIALYSRSLYSENRSNKYYSTILEPMREGIMQGLSVFPESIDRLLMGRVEVFTAFIKLFSHPTYRLQNMLNTDEWTGEDRPFLQIENIIITATTIVSRLTGEILLTLPGQFAGECTLQSSILYLILHADDHPPTLYTLNINTIDLNLVFPLEEDEDQNNVLASNNHNTVIISGQTVHFIGSGGERKEWAMKDIVRQTVLRDEKGRTVFDGVKDRGWLSVFSAQLNSSLLCLGVCTQGDLDLMAWDGEEEEESRYGICIYSLRGDKRPLFRRGLALPRLPTPPIRLALVERTDRKRVHLGVEIIEDHWVHYVLVGKCRIIPGKNFYVPPGSTLKWDCIDRKFFSIKMNLVPNIVTSYFTQ
jgi:hypothetical protein